MSPLEPCGLFLGIEEGERVRERVFVLLQHEYISSALGGFFCFLLLLLFSPKLNQAEKQPEASLPFLEINTSINLLTALN